MIPFKKIAQCILAAVISNYAFADIIELDAENPDRCRQQILNSSDELPIIATFTSNSLDGNSKIFMPKFELLAKQHPNRTFFIWDADKDIAHVTQTLCLQQLGISITPSLMMVGVFKHYPTGETFMSSALRLYWAGQMSVEEMEQFIDVSTSDLKQSLLLK